jgi:hypothetical protein
MWVKKSERFKNWVQQSRRALGMTKNDFRLKTKFSHNKINLIEKGVVPDNKELEVVCTALGKTLEEAFVVIEERPASEPEVVLDMDVVPLMRAIVDSDIARLTARDFLFLAQEFQAKGSTSELIRIFLKDHPSFRQEWQSFKE